MGNDISNPDWINGRKSQYIIAEAGVNHNGRIELAIQLVDAANQAGADCVKFQAYTTAELVTQEAAKAEYQESCGPEGQSQYEMLQRYELSEENFARLKDYCDARNIDFLITPFSRRWVRFFETLNVTAYKIGSGNLRHLDLLGAIGETGKPVIISTGMSDLEQVDQTINRLQKVGCREIAVLHCVSLYPTPIEKVNLKAIHTLTEHTGLITGFSDHTVSQEMGFLALREGAFILEKHLTLDNTQEGPDHRISLEPTQLQIYIESARRAAAMRSEEQRTHIEQNPQLSQLYQAALGDGIKEPTTEELAVKQAAGMSVVSAQSIPKGTIITQDMITVKRPGTGIPADKIEKVIGLTSACDIECDQVIHKIDFEKYFEIKW